MNFRALIERRGRKRKNMCEGPGLFRRTSSTVIRKQKQFDMKKNKVPIRRVKSMSGRVRESRRRGACSKKRRAKTKREIEFKEHAPKKKKKSERRVKEKHHPHDLETASRGERRKKTYE